MIPRTKIDQSVICAVLLLLASVLVNGQGNVAVPISEHPGIALFRQGKNDEAIRELNSATKQKEYKGDGRIWNTLGLAYEKANDFNRARGAFEKAVKFEPGNSTLRSNLAWTYLMLRDTNKAQSETEKAIKLDGTNALPYYIRGTASLWEQKFDDAQKDAGLAMATDPGFPLAYVLSSRTQIGLLGKKLAASENASVRDHIDLMRTAVDVLRVGAERFRDSQDVGMLHSELESIEVFYNHFSKERPVPGTPPDPGVTPLRILTKPKASYTHSARNANVQGSIRLAILLGASGRVERILVLKRLGYGLDEQAVNAARQIKFEPKRKDGIPVSTVVIFDYGFNIY